MRNIGRGFIEYTVRVGQVFVSSHKKHVISAIGLGSCVGVIAFDPEICTGGIAHVQLPDSSERGCSRSGKPFANADTGIRELLNQLEQSGASLDRLFIALAGGAQIGKGKDLFKVGLKNQRSCLRILKKHRLNIHEKHLGGDSWRSVKLYLGAGQISIRGKDDALEIITIPGVHGEASEIKPGRPILSNAEDVKEALAHLTKNSKAAVSSKDNELVSPAPDTNPIITNSSKKESKRLDDERKKISSLKELEAALAHLTGNTSHKNLLAKSLKSKPVKYKSVDEISKGLAHLINSDEDDKDSAPVKT